MWYVSLHILPESAAGSSESRISLHVFLYQLSPENGSRKSSKLDIRSNKLFESHSTTFSVIPNTWFTLINWSVIQLHISTHKDSHLFNYKDSYGITHAQKAHEELLNDSCKIKTQINIE